MALGAEITGKLVPRNAAEPLVEPAPN
jgi:hypothetical protein